MKKRAIFIFVLATLLAVGLWVGNIAMERRQTMMEEQKQQKEWGDVIPLFRNQSISEFYIIRPREHKVDRVLKGSDVQVLVDEIGKYPPTSKLNSNTEIGFMFEVEERRYSFYVPHNGEGSKVEETKEKTQKALEEALPLVDIYSLISPSQIASIQFVGCNQDAAGDASTRRSLSLETADQEVITKIMRILQRVTYESLTLYEEEHKIDLSGIQESDGYHMILSLGETYQQEKIEVFGSRYGFTMDIGFQWNQRFYTMEYGPTKGMLDAIESLAETKVTSLAQNEASPSPIQEEAPIPEKRPNQQEHKEPAAPRLPEDDFIPLPEGLHILGDERTVK